MNTTVKTIIFLEIAVQSAVKNKAYVTVRSWRCIYILYSNKEGEILIVKESAKVFLNWLAWI